MKTIPPDVVQNLVEILQYVASAIIGWVAKWLQNKKKIDDLKKESLLNNAKINHLEQKNKQKKQNAN